MAVGILVVGGLALAGYGFARIRGAKAQKPDIQRLLK
jgi:hypothetical protein